MPYRQHNVPFFFSQMRRLLCVLLCCTLLLPLAACNRQPQTPLATGQSLRIGISVYNQYDTFITLVMERFHHYAKQKQDTSGTGLNITILQENANGNQTTQNNQIESFIKSGCDIICVNLVDRTDASFVIDRVEAAGIPTIFFNREPVAEDLQRGGNLYYVGADAAASGQIQGQLLLDLISAERQQKEEAERLTAQATNTAGSNAGSLSVTSTGEPIASSALGEEETATPILVDKNKDGIIQYVMLEGEAGHQDAIFRTEYSISTLTKAGVAVERLDGAIASWARARAESNMAQWINLYGCTPQGEENKCIEVVFANNDDMALGAIDALEKAGIPQEDWPVIVGVDGTREGLAAVAAGKMAGTVLNNADGQANAMVELACSLFTGSILPDGVLLTDATYIRVPYEAVTKNNVQQYIALYS